MKKLRYINLFENFVYESLEVETFKKICEEIAQENGMTFMEVDEKLSDVTESNIDLIFGKPSKERLEELLKGPYLIISKYSDNEYYLIMIGDKDASNSKFNNAWSMLGEKWDEFAPGTQNPVKLHGNLTHGRGIGKSIYNQNTGEPVGTVGYHKDLSGYEKESIMGTGGQNAVEVFISTQFINGNAKLNN